MNNLIYLSFLIFCDSLYPKQSPIQIISIIYNFHINIIKNEEKKTIVRKLWSSLNINNVVCRYPNYSAIRLKNIHKSLIFV